MPGDGWSPGVPARCGGVTNASIKYMCITVHGTFCMTENFHYANGQYQYDNVAFTC